MKWSEIVATLPEQPSAEREELLLDAIRAGHVVHRWAPLRVAAHGQTIELEVSEDALGVGDAGEFVRVTLSATGAQRLADHLDALLLTPKLSDLIRQQAAVVLEPKPQKPDAQMGWTSRMARHSREVDALKAGRAGLTATVGKDWVLTNRLEASPQRAANYGWHLTHGSAFAAVTSGLSVLQPLGLAHNRFHVDYSQTWRGVRSVARVDGVERPLAGLLQDPVLAAALSHEGPLRVLRQPGVPLAGALRMAAALAAPPPPANPLSLVPRTLRKGMQGADVSRWRAILRLPAGDTFDEETLVATRSWQEQHGLVADGIVGPLTWRAATSAGSFVQARNFGHGRTQPINLLVLHTMEAAEKPETAENVAAWFAGPSAPMASAHYCVDVNSVVQCVAEHDTAFHAPGVNGRSIGVEHAGFARQSAEDWADTYSQTMLRLSARLVAEICGRYGIPIGFVDEQGLQRGDAGITTHAAVSRAFHKSTHTDPGPNFPLDAYLSMVSEYAG